MQSFTLTEEHLKLIRRLYLEDHLGDQPCVCVNIRRPFGNSDIVGDIAEIIGIEPVPVDSEELCYPPGTSDLCLSLYGELGTALQIFVRVERPAAGRYEAPDYTTNWELIAEKVMRPGAERIDGCPIRITRHGSLYRAATEAFPTSAWGEWPGSAAESLMERASKAGAVITPREQIYGPPWPRRRSSVERAAYAVRDFLLRKTEASR